jgi:hypothetical protein
VGGGRQRQAAKPFPGKVLSELELRCELAADRMGGHPEGLDEQFAALQDCLYTFSGELSEGLAFILRPLVR